MERKKPTLDYNSIARKDIKVKCFEKIRKDKKQTATFYVMKLNIRRPTEFAQKNQSHSVLEPRINSRNLNTTQVTRELTHKQLHHHGCRL